MVFSSFNVLLESVFFLKVFADCHLFLPQKFSRLRRDFHSEYYDLKMFGNFHEEEVDPMAAPADFFSKSQFDNGLENGSKTVEKWVQSSKKRDNPRKIMDFGLSPFYSGEERIVTEVTIIVTKKNAGVLTLPDEHGILAPSSGPVLGSQSGGALRP